MVWIDNLWKRNVRTNIPIQQHIKNDNTATLYMYIYMKKYEFCYICVQIQYLDSFHECLHACIWMKLCCLTNLYSHHCILPLFTTLTSVFLELGTRRRIVKLLIMFIQCLYGKFGSKPFWKMNGFRIMYHSIIYRYIHVVFNIILSSIWYSPFQSLPFQP